MNNKSILVLTLFEKKSSGMDNYAHLIQEGYINVSYENKVQSIFVEELSMNYWLFTFLIIFFPNRFLSRYLSVISNYEIIHVTNSPIFSASILHYFSSKFKNKTFIITLHDPIPHVERTLKKRILRFLLVFNNYLLLNILRSNVRVHIHSLRLLRKIRYSHKKIIVAPHPISFKQYTSDSSSYDNSCLLIGRLSYYKGVDIYVDAVNYLNKTYPSFKIDFYLVGEGLLNINYIPDNLFVINKFIDKEDYNQYLSMSTIIVLPYREATASGVITDAIAHNKIVICSNKGTMADYIIDNKTGTVLDDLQGNILGEAIYHGFKLSKSVKYSDFELIKYKFQPTNVCGLILSNL